MEPAGADLKKLNVGELPNILHIHVAFLSPTVTDKYSVLFFASFVSTDFNNTIDVNFAPFSADITSSIVQLFDMFICGDILIYRHRSKIKTTWYGLSQ